MRKGVIEIDEIPQSCRTCRMRRTDGYCIITQKDVFYYGLNYDKPEWCPIKEVSIHGNNSMCPAAMDTTKEKMDISQNASRSEKTIKCEVCNKMSALADTFIFNNKAYCMDCLYSLLMEMADNGHVTIKFDNCEQNGILVEF